ncbi:hypothetical protein RFI_25333 [Reticulomyxa filosa]|uniref:Uncharacterized protein n=1 Tax=Reticulomyxa filosa TaxID=46433 RepID=X6MDE1_RETFI|nr:hypothetical protein RFI_25333 [Reticulomyxa filosa]|eukprot:ETO12043.1 hypothetical protein RFI_25333 [Reticulomyxa filosa]
MGSSSSKKSDTRSIINDQFGFRKGDPDAFLKPFPKEAVYSKTQLCFIIILKAVEHLQEAFVLLGQLEVNSIATKIGKSKELSELAYLINVKKRHSLHEMGLKDTYNVLKYLFNWVRSVDAMKEKLLKEVDANINEEILHMIGQESNPEFSLNFDRHFEFGDDEPLNLRFSLQIKGTSSHNEDDGFSPSNKFISCL